MHQLKTTAALMFVSLSCAADNAARPNAELLPPHAIARVGSLRLKHTSVLRLALSADGKLLASAGEDSAIRMWDTATGQQLRELIVTERKLLVERLALTPDGKLVAVSGPEHPIYVLDTATGKQVHQFEGSQPKGASPEFAFAGDGKSLVAWHNTTRLWDVSTGKEIRRWKGPGDFPHFAFSADGKVLATAAADLVVLEEATTGKELKRLRVSPNGVAALAFSADGRTLATSEADFVRLWDVATGRERARYEFPAASLAFSLDGDTLTTTMLEQCRVWDLLRGKELRQFRAGGAVSRPEVLHPPAILAVSADGSVVASVAWRGNQIHLNDAATGKDRFPVHDQPQFGPFAYTPDSKSLVSPTMDGALRLWSAGTGREIRRFDGPPADLRALAFSPDGKTLTAVGAERVDWDVTSGKAVHRSPAPWGIHAAVYAFSPNGTVLATGAPEGKGFPPDSLSHVTWWDLATGKEIARSVDGHIGVTAVAFSPDGKSIASAGRFDSTIRIWDAATGKELRRTGYPSHDCRLVFAPDGKSLFSVEKVSAKGVRVGHWDASTLQERSHFDGPVGGAIGFAGFSPDGKAAALISPNWEVVILELATGQQLARVQHPPKGRIYGVEFSADGKTLATGHSNGTILIWDLGKLLKKEKR
jgi:WD40 repeat protein